MEFKDVYPKNVVSDPVHGLQIGVVVCKTEGWFTNHTVHWLQLGIHVGVGLSLAVLVGFLVSPSRRQNINILN